MNLTTFEKEQLQECKKKIFQAVAEAEKILSHPIKGISFIEVASVSSSAPSERVAIHFELESI